MSEAISKILLQQRIRNRITEVLDLASSFDDIARFGAFEVINMWEDWVQDPGSDFFGEPVFSEMERAAIRRFHAIWDRCAARTSNDSFDVQTLSAHESWRELRATAESAHKLFEQRGRFAEDKEAF